MARVKYYDAGTGTWKYADEVTIVAPVQSVNGKTGAVVVNREDLGAEQAGAVAEHNSAVDAHGDIRALISELEGKSMLKKDISIKKAQLTLEDGTDVMIDVVVASAGTTIPKYFNWAPKAIDTNGNIYNEVGYMEGYRLNSSGNTVALAESIVTGYIPVKPGDVVRIYGADWATTKHGQNYICAYDSSFAYIGGFIPNTEYVYGTAFVESLERTDTLNGIITLNSLETIAYIRISSAGESNVDSIMPSGSDMIVTVNEEIS